MFIVFNYPQASSGQMQPSVLVWKAGFVVQGTASIGTFSSKKWDQLYSSQFLPLFGNLQFPICKAAILQNVLSTQPHHQFPPTSQQTEMIVVLIGEGAHISLVPSLCLAWVHFTFVNSTFIVTGAQCGNYYHCFSMEETECRRSIENHALSYSSINGRVRI